MTYTLLVTTIITYVLSLAATLILAITSKKMRRDSIRIPAIFHFTMLVLTTIIYLTGTLQNLLPYLILFTFCSGVSLAGWALRINYLKMPFRIYFGAYLLSVLLFLVSPSLLFYSISGSLSFYRKEKEFNLRDNYYLVEQLSQVSQNQKSSNWKVIQKFGIYKKTIQRDISLKTAPDRVQLLEFNKDTMVIRYWFTANGVTDSTDTGFRPVIRKQEITKQKR